MLTTAHKPAQVQARQNSSMEVEEQEAPPHPAEELLEINSYWERETQFPFSVQYQVGSPGSRATAHSKEHLETQIRLYRPITIHI